MLPYRPIRSLYPLALAEGEGVGTAYEYFAKRLVLAPWIARRPRPRRLLIAGLPEKYGSSLDFLLLAEEVEATEVVVIDDRPSALERNQKSMLAAKALGQLLRVAPQYVLTANASQLDELAGEFDLCVGSEILQRLSSSERERYVARLTNSSPAVALFAPNADNGHHTTLSGLSGLRRDEMRALLDSVAGLKRVGYIDMPPFPPGMTRTATQRTQASSGRMEALAMWGLGCYARMESYIPASWRRSHSHIVYALMEKNSSET
jgi:hypothetical protein